jgi:hypothetical protein
MADQWDTYITRAQSDDSTLQPRNPFADIPILGALFGALGGRSSSSGGLQPNKQGLYTPSMLPMPVGPSTPVNYGRIRSLLNSGVLQSGVVPDYVPPPAEPAPTPEPKKRGGLLSFLFGGM